MKPKPLTDDDRAFLRNFRDGFVVPHEYEARLLEVIETLTGERWQPSSQRRSTRPADACLHSNAKAVPSYYSDTEWCPDCGASRGTNGHFGPGGAWLPWELPK